MLAKRIIPCLDVDNGRVVKGTNFVELKDAGDPCQLGIEYDKQLADELVFLDITASHQKRDITLDIVKRTAETVFIPFTVGGGINDIDTIRKLLQAGADKVSLNTGAILNPLLIKQGSYNFGSQCIVVAIDARRTNNAKSGFEVLINGGRKKTGIDALVWAKKAAKLGAGEILLTSMDADGTNKGYDLKLTKLIADNVDVPIIASGGAGSVEDIYQVLQYADAALLASLLH